MVRSVLVISTVITGTPEQETLERIHVIRRGSVVTVKDRFHGSIDKMPSNHANILFTVQCRVYVHVGIQMILETLEKLQNFSK